MTYDSAFFENQKDASYESASRVLPPLIDSLRRMKGVETGLTVLDIGCGVGTWARAAKDLGCKVLGIDGYADEAQLMIDPDEFVRQDLSTGVFDSTGFSLTLCMEVAEHLPLAAAQPLVDSLCKSSDVILFSAAHPGQGGVNHINEQWGSWWASYFLNNNFAGSSDVKWDNWYKRDVQDFYRENMILFARPGALYDLGCRVGVADVIHPQRLGTWA